MDNSSDDTGKARCGASRIAGWIGLRYGESWIIWAIAVWRAFLLLFVFPRMILFGP
jgi:hypothetical protein